MTNKLDASSMELNWDLEQSITLGLAAASLAGIVTACAGSTFDIYISGAVLCFSIVLPVVLTIYAIGHPASKSLKLTEYGAPVAASAVVACIALTLAGFGLLLVHQSTALGLFFIGWCIAAPVVVVLSYVTVGKMLGTARPPERRSPVGPR